MYEGRREEVGKNRKERDIKEEMREGWRKTKVFQKKNKKERLKEK